MMASSTIPSSSSSCFHQLQFPSSTRKPTKPFSVSPIRASVSEKPSSISVPSVSVSSPEPTKLPIRKIPGDHGIPLIGPYKDRVDYFYNQGRDEFFKKRIQKYQSTVFRTNVPPGPLIAKNPNVVVLLDGKSFPTLFDTEKVDKTDVFTGTFMPSTELTGGYRVLSYLDPSEPKHAQLKRLMFFLLKSRREHVIPEFHIAFTELFESLEKELSKNGKVSFGEANDQAAFNFLARSLFGANPAETELDLDGPKLIQKWILFQLSPVLKLGLPSLIEDQILRNFRLPASIIKKDYQRLYNFFYQSSGFIFDEAERLGVSREEACHNLLFATCFNSLGGMKLFFPNVLKWIGRGGVKLHSDLATEVRTAVRSAGGKVTMAAMENMPLMKSVVYEAFRVDPPVPLQFGRVRKDMVIESHDHAFRVKKGEMLFGYQPFATKDPKIFERAEEFVGDRFMGAEGEKLLKHVLWSNGPETATPTVNDKQCAGKDFVTLVSRLLVVELFLRYDSFEIQVGTSPLGSAVTLTSLKRASF
ncbi:allene oxide synthase 1, chloroplastic-like [Lotus japonicus]|uniref:Allene oxide synthase n=1 Tax=Lotus japonicus TaxID=34305 RepID=E9RHS4_LOTJA|nr:allene oxide synthase 1, chloroplastic-like [Lotus japonicus]BAJ78216.1 allene oxide synthase [Lotus japonicus]